MKLILASVSPRRAEILRNAGLSFDARSAHVNENLLPGENAENYVRHLAEAKARAAADSIGIQDKAFFVVGADTVVLCDGQILGKPADANHARAMLSQLSGKVHEVLTGVAVIRLNDRKSDVQVERTSVTFLPLSNADIAEYIATGEPFDKAGAYGIQGLAGKFISRIEGCYFNVMGLPLSKLWQMLRNLGWSENESS